MSTSIFPTLVECFGIILIGYIAGRFSWFTTSEGKGISLFLSNLALPALVFKSMVTVNFDLINWKLWSGLLLGKLAVFVVTIVISLIFHKSSRFGKAGLYGIFVTQSNDFAFGLPLLQATFNQRSNEYLLSYVYLAAPISLAIVNPLGFALLEYQKAKDEAISTPKYETVTNKNRVLIRKIVFNTVKGIVTNPFVFMIVFGIAFNFILRQKLPIWADGLFKTLANAYGATALFYLGWKLGNNPVKVKGMELVVPIILVSVKGIFLPIVMRFIVSQLIGEVAGTAIGNTTESSTILHGTSNIFAPLQVNNTKLDNQTTFAFLYGAIPTAPSVLIYASRYGLCENIIGSGLVIGTILAAPIIYASIQMIHIHTLGMVEHFTGTIDDVCRDVSILSAICLAWVIFFVFPMLRLHKRKPHTFTLMLVCSQFLLAVMSSLFKVVQNATEDTPNSNSLLLKLFLWVLVLAVFACSTWSGIVALSLSFFVNVDERLKKKWKIAAFLFGTVMPVVLSTAVVMAGGNHILSEAKKRDFFFIIPCFINDTVMSVLVLVSHCLTIFTILVALVKLSRTKFLTTHPQTTSAAKGSKILTDSGCDKCSMKEGNKCNAIENTLGSSLTVDIESLDSTACLIKRTQDATDNASIDKDLSFLRNVDEMEQIQLSTITLPDKHHVTNHVLLILYIHFALSLNVIVTVWQMLKLDDYVKGIFLELKMLNVVLIYGQGFFTFLLFGFLKEFFMLPFVERLQRYLSKRCIGEKIQIKDRAEQDPAIVELCDRFRARHLKECAQAIVTNLRFPLKTYNNVFKGSTLVEWVIEDGLANDRQEAVKYCNQLLLGGVIQHCKQKYYFHDLPYIYQFTRSYDASLSAINNESNNDTEPLLGTSIKQQLMKRERRETRTFNAQ